MLFTMNFLGFGMLFAALFLLCISEAVIGRKRLKERRIKRIYKNRYSTVDSKEWRCENCDYVNSRLDSECKSCGKYK